MNIGDILISKDRSYTYRDYSNGNFLGKSGGLDTMLFLEDYFIPGNKYFVKKTSIYIYSVHPIICHNICFFYIYFVHFYIHHNMLV